ncbi:uncharacterized protein LOC135394856 [Ornithodoros turicata]|uniref:uncharacterized protein LOC135394856 n=1 Tax=Ornithodoros turicata TaxID=34597 RepID=UPI003139B95E
MENSKVLTSSFAAVQPIRENIGAYLLKCLYRAADSRLINGTTDESLSFAEVGRQANAAAKSFIRHGIREGDIACFITANCMPIIPALIGLASINAVATYAEMSQEDTVDHLNKLKAVAILCDPSSIKRARAVKELAPSVVNLFVMGECAESDCISWNTLLAEQNGDSTVVEARYIPKHPCYMPTTSGTTGKPKVAIHTHETIMACFMAVSHPDHMPLGPKDVLLSTTALIHVYALFDCTCKAIVQGASSVFLEHCEGDSVLQALQRYKVTSLHTVPYVAQALLNNPRLEDDGIDTLKHMTTASTYIAEATAQELLTRLKLQDFAQLYGQTEIIFATAGVYGERSRTRSMGKLASGVEAVIRDCQTGELLGPGQQGELYLRGPGVMIGYYGRMDEPITDSEGWLKTGDVCYYDSDGYIYLVNRLKEFIKVRGTTIPPAAVETDLLRCPLVKDCAVVGLPDPETEQALHAIVIPSTPTANEEEIQKFMQEHAPDFYQLEGGITLTDRIPRNKIGKFVRKELVQWLLDRKEKKQ